MSKRAYGGVSAQQRKEQRRAALLDAALETIGTQGFSSLSVLGLSRATGLNDRYFAESFDSREDLFSALIDRMLEELAALVAAALLASERDLRSKMRAAVGAAIEYLTDDPRKARVALIEAPAVAVVNQRRREVIDFLANVVRVQLDEHFGVVRSQRMTEALRFVEVHAFGGLMEAVTLWLDGGLEVTRDELIDRSADLMVVLVEHVYAQGL
ncbi:TetR/AcrR family transcriptional regulator [Nocardia sp. NPDC050406]|uniref:TetR/AcrR family transcriptional regulator n=1 Tax=Nocardia sp. NPDC050406 TaxID=3364318 RepID=UPI00379CBF7D